MIKHYPHQATFEQIVAYRPEQSETYTPSPLVNAIAEVLFTSQIMNCSQIAKILGLETRALCVAFKVETGLLLDEVVADYRLQRAQKYIEQNPDSDMQAVAKVCGYASGATLWHAFQRKLGVTPTGKTSKAREERYLAIRKEVKGRFRK